MNNTYNRFENIREIVSDSNIVDELVQYMSTDDLEDFVNHLASIWNIEDNDK